MSYWSAVYRGMLLPVLLAGLGVVVSGAKRAVVFWRRGGPRARACLPLVSVFAVGLLLWVAFEACWKCADSVIVFNHTGELVERILIETPSGPRELGPIAAGSHQRLCSTVSSHDGWLSFVARGKGHQTIGCAGQYLDGGHFRTTITLRPGGEFRVTEEDGKVIHDGPPEEDHSPPSSMQDAPPVCVAWLRRYRAERHYPPLP